MKFRVRRSSDNLLYIQVKEGWFFWKTIKKDGDPVFVHTMAEANIVSREYYRYIKESKKKDDILGSFEIK